MISSRISALVLLPLAAACTSAAPEATLQVGQVLTYAAGAVAPVVAVAMAPDATAVFAAGWGKEVVHFDLATGDGVGIHTIADGDLFEAGAMAWCGDRVAVGTFDRLLLFDRAGALVKAVEGRAQDVGFAPGCGTVYRLGGGAVEAISAVDGTPGARAELGDALSMVVGAEAVYVGRAVDAFSYEAVALTLDTLAIEGRTGTIGSQLEGNAGGLAVLNLGQAKVGPTPGSLVTLDTAGLEDLSWARVHDERPLALAAGFSQGVHLFSATRGEHLDSASVALGDGLDSAQDTVAVGAEAGVALFTVVPRPE